MTPLPQTITIVGASVAGIHLAEQLRMFGFDGGLALIGEENAVPYDRPPLSKQALFEPIRADDIALLDPTTLLDLRIESHLGKRALSLDGKAVELDDGEVVTADHVVVATGARARRLLGQPAAANVHTLRTIDDAVRLRSGLETAHSLVVIGAGLIGSEVASAARELGKQVTVVEGLQAPMLRAMGAPAAAIASELYSIHGVELVAGEQVAALEADGAEASVRLESGRTVTADMVLVAIGSVPNSSWVTGSDDGIACDAVGRAVGREDIVSAVGDVACWLEGAHHRRHEHWTSARDQAAAVACRLTGDTGQLLSLPSYVWTDQFGLKIQVIGSPNTSDGYLTLEGPVDGHGPRGTVIGYTLGGSLVGAALFGTPQRLPFYMRHIRSTTNVNDL